MLAQNTKFIYQSVHCSGNGDRKNNGSNNTDEETIITKITVIAYIIQMCITSFNAFAMSKVNVLTEMRYNYRPNTFDESV